MDNKQLYRELEALRTEDPVLWAILIGKRTPHTVAEHLIMTPASVKHEFDRLIQNEIISKGQYMGNTVYKVVDPGYQEFSAFAWKFRTQLKKNK